MFAEDEDEKVHNLKQTEMICEIYNIEQLKDLNARLADNATAKSVFMQVLTLSPSYFQKKEKWLGCLYKYRVRDIGA